MATQPPINGPAQDQVNDLLNQDAAKGRVAVYSFDPNASPQDKAAATAQGREQLKSVVEKTVGEGPRGVAVDTGASKVVPTITVQDSDAQTGDKGKGKQQHQAQKSPANGQPVDDDTPVPPGAMPRGHAPPIPDWYKVGWRSVSGIDGPPLAEGEETDKGILDLFLAEQFYGDWYHNAGLIVVLVFASHFLTRFHFGWGWLFVLLAFANTYYSTSMERVRRRARDDIQRELVKTRLLSEHETADWLNNFLNRFWLIYEPVLSATIISSVDQILSISTPPFLESLRLTTFTLGTKAPRIDKVRTFPKTPDEIVVMDWGISFTPNDISDMTPRQAATKVNPKIVLSVGVGKGLATAAMPILLEDITFTGLMRIRLKLMNNFPHIQLVEMSFLEPPVIDYVLKPIGGEHFGFDIASIPGLSPFIRGLTHATLGPMMYDPNVFTLNLEQLLSGTPLDAAIGVVQITLHSARGIKGAKIGGGNPDPFVSISINNRAELATTAYKPNTSNPTWSEIKFILVNNLSESLVLSVFDWNEHRKNTALGAASFELAALLQDATHEGIEQPILKDGKERGQLKFDIAYYPVLKPEHINGEDVVPESTVGIVRLTLHQAKELDVSKSLSGDLNPFASVHLGGSSHAVHTTQRFKHTNNPVWESPTEFLCTDRLSSIITIKVVDDRDFLKDPILGYMSIRLQDLLDAKKEAGRDWWPLSGCKSGRVRMSVEWKPLSMAGSFHGADQYVPPIGVVRLHLEKAVDVKNVEAALGGKSDPYVRVQNGDVTLGRTEVVNNNLNPIWDEIIYIPVHSLKETLVLECMDYQHLTKDRSLGSLDLRISDLAKATPDPRYPFQSAGKRVAQDYLQLNDGVRKGQLHYTAEFVPALGLEWQGFSKGGNEIQRATEQLAIKKGDDASSIESSDGGVEGVPEGITVHAPIGSTTAPTPPKEAEVQATKAGPEATGGKSNDEKPKDEIPKDEKPKVERVTMTKEDLLKQQSGVIIFNVAGGEIVKKARLEVLLGDAYWPAFSTPKARSTKAHWEYVGEGFVKELDFAKVWLRLDESDEGIKDDIIGAWEGDVKTFLRDTLDGPKKFTLTDPDHGTSTVEIEARYIPVPIQLEPRESINNQGILRVEVIGANGIPSADRGGKSDPYAVFSLNGQRVYRSQTKKKTLKPEWNENFECQVSSRTAADFSVEIFDWNQIEQAKSLGTAKIDLAPLEPFQASDLTLPLVSAKHGDKGTVHVRLVFHPEVIVKTRKNTSTFNSAGRALTQIGGLPMGATKGVFQGVTGVFKKEKDFANGGTSALQPVADGPTGQSSHPVSLPDTLGGGTAAAFPSVEHGNTGVSHDPGTLRLTVVGAKDLGGNDLKPYVTIRLGDKEVKTKHAKSGHPEWNESFTLVAGPLTPKLYFWLHDHKTLGKDKPLGEGDVDIWRHIQSDRTSSADVTAEIREGAGQIQFRLEFDADANPALAKSGSTASMDRNSILGSPSKFSILGRRSMTAEREGSTD